MEGSLQGPCGSSGTARSLQASVFRAVTVCRASPPAGVRVRPDRGGALLERALPAPRPAVSCALVSAHHRTMREDYGDKVKAGHWSRSPLRPPRERFELADGRKPGEGAERAPGDSPPTARQFASLCPPGARGAPSLGEARVCLSVEALSRVLERGLPAESGEPRVTPASQPLREGCRGGSSMVNASPGDL